MHKDNLDLKVRDEYDCSNQQAAPSPLSGEMKGVTSFSHLGGRANPLSAVSPDAASLHLALQTPSYNDKTATYYNEQEAFQSLLRMCYTAEIFRHWLRWHARDGSCTFALLKRSLASVKNMMPGTQQTPCPAEAKVSKYVGDSTTSKCCTCTLIHF